MAFAPKQSRIFRTWYAQQLAKERRAPLIIVGWQYVKRLHDRQNGRATMMNKSLIPALAMA